jgi:hypothetical protein
VDIISVFSIRLHVSAMHNRRAEPRLCDFAYFRAAAERGLNAKCNFLSLLAPSRDPLAAGVLSLLPCGSMLTVRAALLFLFITLPGCVVTYGNFPDVSFDSLPKDHEPKALSYYINPIPYTLFDASSGGPTDPADSSAVVVVIPNWYPLAMKDFRQAGVREVSRTLQISGMFSELILGDAKPSDQGTYLNIDFHIHAPSSGAVSTALRQTGGCNVILLCLLGAWGAIPYYSDEGGLTANYHLYKNGTPQHTYQYRIYKKGVGGLLLLPFAWLNFLTDDLTDALRATTFQFLIDAQRDGNF